MPSTLIVPDGFSYLVASLVGTSFLLVGQTMVVSRFRKASGIQYPQLYAEKAEVLASQDAMKFNCAQRAHQNTLEQIPSLYLGAVVTGLKYPQLATGLIAVWTVAKIFYTRGYITGDPKKRTNPISMFGSISSLLLIGTSAFSAYQLITEGI